MSNVYVVSYDLKGPSAKYSEMYELLKGQKSWWHYLASTWLVASDLTATELRDEILPFTQKGDRLLVVPLTAGYSGWLPAKAWKWIKRHLDES